MCGAQIAPVLRAGRLRMGNRTLLRQKTVHSPPSRNSDFETDATGACTTTVVCAPLEHRESIRDAAQIKHLWTPKSVLEDTRPRCGGSPFYARRSVLMPHTFLALTCSPKHKASRGADEKTEAALARPADLSQARIHPSKAHHAYDVQGHTP